MSQEEDSSRKYAVSRDVPVQKVQSNQRIFHYIKFSRGYSRTKLNSVSTLERDPKIMPCPQSTNIWRSSWKKGRKARKGKCQGRKHGGGTVERKNGRQGKKEDAKEVRKDVKLKGRKEGRKEGRKRSMKERKTELKKEGKKE
jgi:hypothetical protein